MERRKKERKNQILKVAEQLFMVEQNYEHCTIREIARRANISVGAVYLCFKNKTEILAELILLHVKQLREELAKAISGNLTAAEKLEALLTLLEKVRKDVNIKLYGRFAIEKKSSLKNKEILYIMKEEYNNIIDIVTSIFKMGSIDGTLVPMDDCKLSAVVFVQILHSFIRDLMFEMSPSSFLLGSSYDEDVLFYSFERWLRNSLLSDYKSQVLLTST